MNDHIYLAHHGIKGMKLGVRRFQNPDGTLTPRGKKQQQKRNELASRLESKASQYKRASKEFKVAADTMERDGIRGKSKYMRRLNETDWTSVYDYGSGHKKDFKDAVSEIRKSSTSAARWADTYKKAAEYLRSNPEAMSMSYKDCVKALNNGLYKNAGYDMYQDWDFIVEDFWDIN